MFTYIFGPSFDMSGLWATNWAHSPLRCCSIRSLESRCTLRSSSSSVFCNVRSQLCSRSALIRFSLRSLCSHAVHGLCCRPALPCEHYLSALWPSTFARQTTGYCEWSDHYAQQNFTTQRF